jgi:hypothetical protein
MDGNLRLQELYYAARVPANCSGHASDPDRTVLPTTVERRPSTEFSRSYFVIIGISSGVSQGVPECKAFEASIRCDRLPGSHAFPGRVRQLLRQ